MISDSSISYSVRHKPLMGLMIVTAVLFAVFLFTFPSSFALPVNPDGDEWNVDVINAPRFLFDEWRSWNWHVRFPVEGETFKDVNISDEIGLTYNGVTNRISHASGGSSVYSLINPALTNAETNYTTELIYDFYGSFFEYQTGERTFWVDDIAGLECSFDVVRDSGFRYNYLQAYLITDLAGTVGYQYIDSFWDFSPGATQHIGFTYGGPGYSLATGGYREYILGIRLVFGTSNQSNVSKGLGFTISNWSGVFFYGGIVIPDETQDQLGYIINGKVYHNPPPSFPSSDSSTLDDFHNSENALLDSGSSYFTDAIALGRRNLADFSGGFYALSWILTRFFNSSTWLNKLVYILLPLGLVATFLAIVPAVLARFRKR